MKIYTVQRMDQYDYDFSVLTTKYNAYKDHNKAFECSRKVYENMCEEYCEEMEMYSKEDEYDQGSLYIEEDDENGYYHMSFGREDEHESHCISVEEFDVNTIQRDDLLVTAGSRIAYMDMKNKLNLPDGVDGESEIATFLTQKVDEYLENNDIAFDIFIENAINIQYGKE